MYQGGFNKMISKLPFKITALVKTMAKTQVSWRKQFFYQNSEEDIKDFETTDPINDKKHEVCEGLIHRYPDRVLVLVTKSCPVYCRFCFRKDVIENKSSYLTLENWAKIVSYLKDHPAIREIIFSGGDSFYVPAAILQEYFKDLISIKSIKIVRFHTRVLTLSPDILLQKEHLYNALKNLSAFKAIYVLAHINHPDEFTEKSIMAIKRIQRLEIPILSQSVLLKEINDSEEILLELCQKLTENKIIPAYLHQLDHAPGTFHFYVPISRGRELIKWLQGKIANYGIPKYILELPEGLGKVPIHSSFIKEEYPDYYVCSNLDDREEIKIQKM